MDCPTYLANAVDASKGVGVSLATVAGSWGGLATALQAVPPGGELCGAELEADDAGQPEMGHGRFVNVAIRSPLFGADLRSFYDPVMTAAGCAFKSDGSVANLQTRLTYSCPASVGGLVTIATDTGAQVYGIGGLAP
jgi:hypothetical protein